MEASFSACLRHVLAMEGGFSNDPANHGGATNWGITAATLAHWRGRPVTAADVRTIPPGEARAIYHASASHWSGLPTPPLLHCHAEYQDRSCMTLGFRPFSDKESNPSTEPTNR